MKSKVMTILAGAMVLMLILLTGSPMAAATPSGEINIVAPMWGNELPLPSMEGGHGADWMKLLYTPLVGTTPDCTLSPQHGIAEKWEMSPDGLTWTFHIRKGIKFHDGVEVTAKDVKFSIEMAKRPAAKGFSSSSLRLIVKSMEVKDPYTLVLHCKKSYLFVPGFLSDIGGPNGMIQPKDAYEKAGHDKFLKHPIGSGPYKWHSHMVGSSIKLEAVDRHWRDGVPRYKYVTFSVIPEQSTRIALLKNGEADICRIGRDKVQEMKDAGLKVVSKQNSAIAQMFIPMTWSSPVFSDIRFRKAITLAIDKEAIIKHIFNGMGKLTTTYPGSNIHAVRGIPKLKPYPYDVEEAKRLIKEGGYEGFEFVVPSYNRAGCPEWPRVVETVCGYWEKIGLKPKIFMTEYNTWRKKWRTQKTQGSIMGTESATSPDVGEILKRYRTKLYSKSKLAQIQSPVMDEMLDKAASSLDLPTVEKHIGDIYRWVYDQYTWIGICEIPDTIATTKRIPKWDPGYRRHDRNLNDIIRQR